nr:MAG TPA: hypothetical protein [Caudoviricetes sp.]
MALPGLRSMVATRPTGRRLLGADKHAQSVPAVPPEMESRTQTPKGPHMSIDITQQALNALADAGLGNDSPAEAYVIGYTQGHDDALALAIQLERSINRRPFMPDEAERLAMRLHEQVGDCPIAHESGKAMDDSEREWWVNLAASAWTLIDGTEETE